MWDFAKNMLDKRLGDKVKPFTLHDLRRTTATGMANLGILPHVIEMVLNHQSGHKGGIGGVYNRSSYEREVRAALVAWADHVTALVAL
jgi:integrase